MRMASGADGIMLASLGLAVGIAVGARVGASAFTSSALSASSNTWMSMRTPSKGVVPGRLLLPTNAFVTSDETGPVPSLPLEPRLRFLAPRRLHKRYL